jgi:hypothetical protein
VQGQYFKYYFIQNLSTVLSDVVLLEKKLEMAQGDQFKSVKSLKLSTSTLS